MSRYHLAQLNVGIIRAPLDSPVMADFVGNLDRINALAESSPGFVWRLQTDEGNATALRPTDDENLLVNMSVWEDAESLSRFVFKSSHVEIMRRRAEWFQRMADAYLVLWWVPSGHRPTIEEALARLAILRASGPTPDAFNFRTAFPPPDAERAGTPFAFGNECPAA
jgi:Domain of unknown function (DUF3291)